MSATTKYDAYAICATDKTWTGRVVRRRTSKGTVVEHESRGFASQEEAMAWSQAKLEEYLARRKRRTAQRNANRSARKRAVAARMEVLSKYSYRELALRSESEPDCLAEFKDRSELLWQEVAFRMLKEGFSEEEAYSEADERVGRRHKKRLENGLSGQLDTVAFGTQQMAFANAQTILNIGLAMLRQKS